MTDAQIEYLQTLLKEGRRIAWNPEDKTFEPIVAIGVGPEVEPPDVPEPGPCGYTPNGHHIALWNVDFNEMIEFIPLKEAADPVPAIEETLEAKLNPARFTSMSNKMAAIVAFVLDAKTWETDPKITEITNASGTVLAATSFDPMFNEVLGDTPDLLANWRTLLNVAGLSSEERALADRLFASKITRL